MTVKHGLLSALRSAAARHTQPDIRMAAIVFVCFSLCSLIPRIVPSGQVLEPVARRLLSARNV